MDAADRPAFPGSAAGGVHVAPPLTPARRAVLYAVRVLGDPGVEAVADELEMTVSGARQHLAALVEAGLLVADEQPREGRRGRPAVTYHVAAPADPLFPTAYGALTNELLGYLDEDDDHLVDALFARRRRHRIDRARIRLAPLDTLADRVAELARILDEDGYLATAVPDGDGTLRLVEHNCAIVDVARRYGQACASEIDFIRAVLPDARVTRVRHLLDGARHCAYEIVAA